MVAMTMKARRRKEEEETKRKTRSAPGSADHQMRLNEEKKGGQFNKLRRGRQGIEKKHGSNR